MKKKAKPDADTVAARVAQEREWQARMRGADSCRGGAYVIVSVGNHGNKGKRRAFSLDHSLDSGTTS